MADFIGAFPSTLALDDRNNVVREAEAYVYDVNDTNLASPLPVTDLQGVPFTGGKLVASNGILPQFRTPEGVLEVFVKSGGRVTQLVDISVYAGEARAAAGRAEESASEASAANSAAGTARLASEEAARRAEAVGFTTDDITGDLLTTEGTKSSDAVHMIVGEAVGAAVPEALETTVPPAVADAIASDPTVIERAAALAQADAGLARHISTFGENAPAWTVVDANGRRLWIEADEQGRPTLRAARAVMDVAGAPKVDETYEPGFYFADANGVPVRDLRFDQKGEFEQGIVERLGSRTRAASVTPVRRRIRRLSTETAALLNQAANNAVRHMLQTWIPNRFPGTAPITTLGGGLEDAVRHPAAAAFSIAALIRAGIYTGTVPVADAKASALRVIAGITSNHRANKTGGWGDYWQSALWAQMTAAAAWMLWDDVPASTRAELASLVQFEADRFLTTEPTFWTRYDGTETFPGDSKAEELAWDGGALLFFGTVLYPEHAHSATWVRQAHPLLIAAGVQPNDVLAGRTVQGLRVDEEFDGWNVNQNGSIINHDIVHPDYICSNAELAWSAGVLVAHGGARIPDGAVMNAESIYRALVDVRYAGRTIYTPDSWLVYYPQGNDWGTHRIADKAMADVVAHCLGLDSNVSTPADRWARLHLERCVSLQNRFADGRTYGDQNEDVYPGREPWVARNLALAVLANAMPTTSRYTYAPFQED